MKNLSLVFNLMCLITLTNCAGAAAGVGGFSQGYTNQRNLNPSQSSDNYQHTSVNHSISKQDISNIVVACKQKRYSGVYKTWSEELTKCEQPQVLAVAPDNQFLNAALLRKAVLYERVDKKQMTIAEANDAFAQYILQQQQNHAMQRSAAFQSQPLIIHETTPAPQNPYIHNKMTTCQTSDPGHTGTLTTYCD